MVWLRENRPTLKAKYPSLLVTELSKKAGDSGKHLEGDTHPPLPVPLFRTYFWREYEVLTCNNLPKNALYMLISSLCSSRSGGSCSSGAVISPCYTFTSSKTYYWNLVCGNSRQECIILNELKVTSVFSLVCVRGIVLVMKRIWPVRWLPSHFCTCSLWWEYWESDPCIPSITMLYTKLGQ